MRKGVLIALMIIVLVGAVTVSAQTSNGKPFNEIWDAIQELRDRIDNIELVPGPPGPAGPSGEQGSPGADGISCWDLNGNGVADLATEDKNGDNVVDVLDCQGPPGPGLSCENELAIAEVIPGFELSPECVPTVPTFVIINEVYYDEPSTDGANIFTELYGAPGMVLTGYSLVGINGASGGIYRTVDLTGGIIPSDGFFVIAKSSATGSTLAERDFIGNVDWQNGPDGVQLIGPDGSIIDALQYGDAGIYNAGEGTPAPDTAGNSLSRDVAHTDTDDNSADFSITNPPTPGS